MKLTIPTLLEGVADVLRDQVAPQVGDAFTGDALRMAQSLIRIAAKGEDDAAAIRVAENARMRALFGEARDAVTDSGLSARLDQAARSADPGYRISQLDVETGRLRLLLIELHTWLEGQEGDAFRALDQAIWRAMRDFEEARRPRA